MKSQAFVICLRFIYATLIMLTKTEEAEIK